MSRIRSVDKCDRTQLTSVDVEVGIQMGVPSDLSESVKSLILLEREQNHDYYLRFPV